MIESLIGILSGRSSNVMLDDFVFTIETTSPNQSFTMPLNSGLTYDYDVDWGDTVKETNVDNHTYTLAGTYQVRVTPRQFPEFIFNNGGDKDLFISVDQWGKNQLINVINMFRGCTNMTHCTLSDSPDLSLVTTLRGMFSSCGILQYIGFGNWDISTINSLSNFLFFARDYNESWASVDLSNITDISAMMFQANNFNSPINLNLNSVITANSAFRSCTSFDQDCSTINLSSATNLTDFMKSVTLSTVNYDNLLVNLLANGVQSGITTHFGGSTYTIGGAGETARNTLINTYGWTITDGGGV